MTEYRRVLLKLSGEALSEGPGINYQNCLHIARSLYEGLQAGLQLGLVIGSGNIWRGASSSKGQSLPRVPADQVGMLATLMNARVMQQALCEIGATASVMSSFVCGGIAELYNWDEAMRRLEKGHLVLFAGGTGHPYFTTDSTAALRACEINADLLLKATKVDGIYDKDPLLHSDAQRYETLSYDEVLHKNLKVMDGTAFTLCRDQNIPIRVFNFSTHSLLEAVKEKSCGTLVQETIS